MATAPAGLPGTSQLGDRDLYVVFPNNNRILREAPSYELMVNRSLDETASSNVSVSASSPSFGVEYVWCECVSKKQRKGCVCVCERSVEQLTKRFFLIPLFENIL